MATLAWASARPWTRSSHSSRASRVWSLRRRAAACARARRPLCSSCCSPSLLSPSWSRPPGGRPPRAPRLRRRLAPRRRPPRYRPTPRRRRALRPTPWSSRRAATPAPTRSSPLSRAQARPPRSSTCRAPFWRASPPPRRCGCAPWVTPCYGHTTPRPPAHRAPAPRWPPWTPSPPVPRRPAGTPPTFRPTCRRSPPTSSSRPTALASAAASATPTDQPAQGLVAPAILGSFATVQTATAPMAYAAGSVAVSIIFPQSTAAAPDHSENWATPDHVRHAGPDRPGLPEPHAAPGLHRRRGLKGAALVAGRGAHRRPPHLRHSGGRRGRGSAGGQGRARAHRPSPRPTTKRGATRSWRSC